MIRGQAHSRSLMIRYITPGKRKVKKKKIKKKEKIKKKVTGGISLIYFFHFTLLFFDAIV
jgi:hypothetical protein